MSTLNYEKVVIIAFKRQREIESDREKDINTPPICQEQHPTIWLETTVDTHLLRLILLWEFCCKQLPMERDTELVLTEIPFQSSNTHRCFCCCCCCFCSSSWRHHGGVIRISFHYTGFNIVVCQESYCPDTWKLCDDQSNYSPALDASAFVSSSCSLYCAPVLCPHFPITCTPTHPLIHTRIIY